LTTILLQQKLLPMRLVAALLLLIWTACYARCGAELFGFQTGSDAVAQVDDCCHHEQAPTSGSSSDGMPCGICDAIASGGLLMNQPLSLLAMLFTVCVGLLAGVPGLRMVLQATLRRACNAVCDIPDPPDRAPRFSEFLARTACPVRGPTWALA
jgi:hypothetical protein